MHLLPGTEITKDLRLSRALNEGAMGSVWEAEHSQLGAVAVKFIAGRQLRSKDARARFRREASVLGQLQNLNIVRTFGHGVMDDDTPYVVMELLNGESLEARLTRQGQLPLDDVAAIVMQLGYALSEVHKNGIIHRDVKPDNIFLVGEDDFPLLKLVDFGMARHERVKQGSIVTAVGVSVGTPDYMSPEQVLGSADVDWRCDLWACAVVAYRMLCGELPFDGQSPHALVFSICRGEFRPIAPSGPHSAFLPWFERVFVPDKLKRYTTAQEQGEAFQEVVKNAMEIRVVLGDEHTEELDIAKLMAQSAARSGYAVSSEARTLRPDGVAMDQEEQSSELLTEVYDMTRGAGLLADAPTQVMEEALPSLPLPPESVGLIGMHHEDSSAEEDESENLLKPEMDPLATADTMMPPSMLESADTVAPPVTTLSRGQIALALLLGLLMGGIGLAVMWRF